MVPKRYSKRRACWTRSSSEYMLAASNALIFTNACACSFVDAMSPLPRFDPIPPECDTFGNTMNPATIWPASLDVPDASPQLRSTQGFPQAYSGLPTRESPLSSSSFELAPRPSSVERPLSSSTMTGTIASRRSVSLKSSTPPSNASDTGITSSPGESDKTRRARYAANQRHSKARKARKDSHHDDNGVSGADELAQKRKERHREKNKIAAAKCRSRQRKQVQTIQEKSTRLAEKNVELKTVIQELRGELNGLRSIALGHQHCNCYVTRYNESQAERVVAEYRSYCNSQHLGSFEQPQPQP